MPRERDGAGAARSHLRSASEPRKPRKKGRPSPTRSPATRPIREKSRYLGRTAAVTTAVGRRPSSVWRPYSGVAPTIAAARADGPLSRFVRAPRTEFAKQTAFDSAQATCSPKAGRTPTWYGVHVKVGGTAIRSYAA